MERKGRVCLLFLRPSNREIWGRVDCEKKKKVRERASLCESSVKFRQLKTAQAYRIRAKRKHGYLSLSVCALWPTTRHLHLWMRHLHLWTWPRIRMNIRLFRIDGVCVVNKGSFRVLKPVFKFLKVYYVVSLHWKEVRKLPGRRIALPVSLSNLCI